jgi:hypothetical protein
MSFVINVVEIVKLSAFQHNIFQCKILIEFISEVVSRVLCSLFPFGFVLSWEFKLFYVHTLLLCAERPVFLQKMSKFMKVWLESDDMYTCDLGSYIVGETELLDNCCPNAASFPRLRKHITALITCVTESLQVFRNKCLTVRFKVLKITVFGM